MKDVIKVPIKLYKGTEEDAERRELLGLSEEEDTEDRELVVYTKHISAHCASNEGLTIMYLAGAIDSFMVYLSYKEFLKLLQ